MERYCAGGKTVTPRQASVKRETKHGVAADDEDDEDEDDEDDDGEDANAPYDDPYDDSIEPVRGCVCVVVCVCVRSVAGVAAHRR